MNHCGVYNVISLPTPINKTSNHATRLLNLPEDFIITSDHQFYLTLTKSNLAKCIGTFIEQCPFNIALTPITTESCILASYVKSKEKVQTMCDFRFVHNTVRSEVIE